MTGTHTPAGGVKAAHDQEAMGGHDGPGTTRGHLAAPGPSRTSAAGGTTHELVMTARGVMTRVRATRAAAARCAAGLHNARAVHDPDGSISWACKNCGAERVVADRKGWR